MVSVYERGTLIGKIGNIQHLWFLSVTVKIFDITMQYAETNLLRIALKTLDWNSNFHVDFQSIYFYINHIEFIIKQIQLYKDASLLNLMSCTDLYLLRKFILQKVSL